MTDRRAPRDRRLRSGVALIVALLALTLLVACESGPRRELAGDATYAAHDAGYPLVESRLLADGDSYVARQWQPDARRRLPLDLSPRYRPALAVARGLLEIASNDELVMVAMPDGVRLFASWATCYRHDIAFPPTSRRAPQPLRDPWVHVATLTHDADDDANRDRVAERITALAVRPARDREPAAVWAGTATGKLVMWALPAPREWIADRQQAPFMVAPSATRVVTNLANDRVTDVAVLSAARVVVAIARSGLVMVVDDGAEMRRLFDAASGLWEAHAVALYTVDAGQSLRLAVGGYDPVAPLRLFGIRNRGLIAVAAIELTEVVTDLARVSTDASTALLCGTASGHLLMVEGDAGDDGALDVVSVGVPDDRIDTDGDRAGASDASALDATWHDALPAITSVAVTRDGGHAVCGTPYGAWYWRLASGRLGSDMVAIAGEPSALLTGPEAGAVLACAFHEGSAPLLLVARGNGGDTGAAVALDHVVHFAALRPVAGGDGRE